MMLMTEKARRARQKLNKNARRKVTVLKRRAHRMDRRATRQLIKTGSEDALTLVTCKVTERHVH